MFPFQFLDRLEKYDVVCAVSGGGRSVQAGAIRLASAKALCSFVTEQEVEFMRQGGNIKGGGGTYFTFPVLHPPLVSTGFCIESLS